jgi:hypothetical protein
MTLTFAGGVSSGVVANWIYDKLIGKARSLTIERTEVNIDAESIRVEIERVRSTEPGDNDA